MIADILPAPAAVAESTRRPSRSRVRGSSPPRRRWCARAGPAAPGRVHRRPGVRPDGAGQRSACPTAPVLAGRAGEPRWPAGVTGSITHCAGYRACAVARTTDLAGLGIDAEPDAGLPAGLIESVGRPRRAGLDRPAGGGRSRGVLGPAAVQRQGGGGQALVPADRALAGARPARRLRRPRPARSTSQVAGSRLTGRWLARDGLIVTAVTWPQPGRPQTWPTQSR